MKDPMILQILEAIIVIAILITFFYLCLGNI